METTTDRGAPTLSKSQTVFKQAEKSSLRDKDSALELYDEVIALCRDAIDLHYERAKLYFLIGRACYELEDKENARQAFESALAFETDSTHIRYELALTCVDLEDDNAAVREFERLLLLKQYDLNDEDLQTKRANG